MIQAHDLILFQGDSITDTGRNREKPAANAGLGGGYVNLIACRLRCDHPADDLHVINRGISGDRITSLMARWKADCINLKPTVLSVLIGINDIWHEFNTGTGTSIEKYGRYYRELLDDTRKALPGVRLVLCEPFVTRCGAVKDEWLPVLAQEQQIVRQLAKDFSAVFVPFQNMFDELCKIKGPEYWSGDGVHPTLAGHQRMADLWIKTVA